MPCYQPSYLKEIPTVATPFSSSLSKLFQMRTQTHSVLGVWCMLLWAYQIRTQQSLPEEKKNDLVSS